MERGASGVVTLGVPCEATTVPGAATACFGGDCLGGSCAGPLIAASMPIFRSEPNCPIISFWSQSSSSRASTPPNAGNAGSVITPCPPMVDRAELASGREMGVSPEPLSFRASSTPKARVASASLSVGFCCLPAVDLLYRYVSNSATASSAAARGSTCHESA